MADNQIVDISALKNLTKLNNLGLDKNPVADINPLKNMTKLNFLTLNINQLKNVSALKSLKNLKHFWLSDTNPNFAWIRKACEFLPHGCEVAY